jgi:hypothetical protein
MAALFLGFKQANKNTLKKQKGTLKVPLLVYSIK